MRSGVAGSLPVTAVAAWKASLSPEPSPPADNTIRSGGAAISSSSSAAEPIEITGAPEGELVVDESRMPAPRVFIGVLNGPAPSRLPSPINEIVEPGCHGRSGSSVGTGHRRPELPGVSG